MNAHFTIAICHGKFMRPAGVARVSATGPLRGHWSAVRGAFQPSRRSLRALCAKLRQGMQARELVGRHGQRQKLVDLIQYLHHHLVHRTDELAPAEVLLDAPSLALADLVVSVSGRASIDGTAPIAVGVLRNVRLDVDASARRQQALGVVGLVRTHRHALARSGDAGQHLRGHVALGRAVLRARLHFDNKSVAVVGQHVPSYEP